MGDDFIHCSVRSHLMCNDWTWFTHAEFLFIEIVLFLFVCVLQDVLLVVWYVYHIQGP